MTPTQQTAAILLAAVLVLLSAFAVAGELTQQKEEHPVRRFLSQVVNSAKRVFSSAADGSSASSSSSSGGGGDCPQGTAYCAGPDDGVCCSDASEACCPDEKHGGICCISEETKCCPPQPLYDHPSRCCPQWFVCCDNGRYGCCDPDTMLPIEAGTSAYALLLEPTWIGDMKFDAAEIILETGKYTQNSIPKSEFNTWGETPRSFMYNSKLNVFYLLQANFTVPHRGGGDPKREIHLFTIDASTGKATRKTVVGADDEVTGYHYVGGSLRRIVFSTYQYANSSSKKDPIGYKFYHLDPLSSTATFVSQFVDTSGKWELGKWGGFFHDCSPDGKYLFRLGYQHVTTSANYGLGITDISVNPAKTTWMTIAYPNNHDMYRTLTVVNAGSPTIHGNRQKQRQQHKKKEFGLPDITFASLAATDNTTREGSLDLFLWSLTDSSNTTLAARFPNAHRTPYFGPIQQTVSDDGNTYAALVVANSPWGTDSDTLDLAVASLLPGGNSSEVPLNPELLAATVSMAGIGIPDSASKWMAARHKK